MIHGIWEISHPALVDTSFRLGRGQGGRGGQNMERKGVCDRGGPSPTGDSASGEELQVPASPDRLVEREPEEKRGS